MRRGGRPSENRVVGMQKEGVAKWPEHSKVALESGSSQEVFGDPPREESFG